MSDDAILAGINQVLREHLGLRQDVGPEARLRADVATDSLALLTLVVELESHFRIRFDDSDERGIDCVGDLVKVVSRRLAEQRP